MNKIKVMSVFGTRPEAIKMSPLLKEMELFSNSIHSIICVTAQHRQMLDQVLKTFSLTPHYDLNIMKQGQTLTDITSNVLKGLEHVIQKEQPNIILTHGDTTTTFVASLAAFYNKVKIGHVEAGLRSYDKYQPFPEEINRKLTGVLADLHFAPTQASKQNLLKENVPEESIFVTGNTVIDCLKTTIKADYTFSADILNKINYSKNRVIAMTAHRRENLGEPLLNICHAVKRIVCDNEDVVVVYAVHSNPKVKQTAYEVLGNTERILLIDPIDLNDMHNLISRSYLVLTDSGGLQEEAPSAKKPVLVLRNVTERPEGILAKTLKLAGVSEQEVYYNIALLLNDKKEYEEMVSANNPFGDGFASKRIINALLYHFGISKEKPEQFSSFALS